MDEVNLHQEPDEVLAKALDYYKSRLKAERAELAQYEKVIGEQTEAAKAYVEGLREDVAMTESLVNDYRAARKLVRDAR